MSKKQNQKKKITVKVLPGQAIYVADVDTLKHISETYLYLAQSFENENDRQSCIDVSGAIEEWIEKTQYDASEGFEDEEW
jgi:hypothetical protein